MVGVSGFYWRAVVVVSAVSTEAEASDVELLHGFDSSVGSHLENRYKKRLGKVARKATLTFVHESIEVNNCNCLTTVYPTIDL